MTYDIYLVSIDIRGLPKKKGKKEKREKSIWTSTFLYFKKILYHLLMSIHLLMY